ncbi:MAG: DNA mismatch repair endonuclease MutL [Lachnospiraceae bacterium]|nr:DNA mismatch repair endonuclease MutL [Lachnospiraceae bacterium]
MRIEILDQQTIDKIAAGEVVERPASVAKELVENSIDSGATAITVEVRDGGITLLRVTDNGSGIPHDEVQRAFLRHSTSKLRDVTELNGIRSLGFRGEALSSIAAVARVEMITKTRDEVTGTSYIIEGGVEKEIHEVGAPDGTTFFVRQIFYNTPARKKFLKSPLTEGNYVTDVMEKLAISHPDIAFRLLNNGREVFSTPGNGVLRDTIYQIYGREITSELIEVDEATPHFHLRGFVGRPLINRGNRSYEIFFVDGRYVKSDVLTSALEEGYTGYLMQHRYPFACLSFDFELNEVDVNVHPTKQEVRFSNRAEVYSSLVSAISDSLRVKEDINTVTIGEKKPEPVITMPASSGAEPFEKKRLSDVNERMAERINEGLTSDEEAFSNPEPSTEPEKPAVPDASEEKKYTFEQQIFLTPESIKSHRIIGQVFDTYWLVEFDDCLYMIDQHAAHEKVLYERTMERIRDMKVSGQQINPPVLISLSDTDKSLLFENRENFHRLGFEFDDFGDGDISLTAIPTDLFGIEPKGLFLDMVGDLSDIAEKKDPDAILERIASMSCKAAVKGHDHLSMSEIETLIDDLLSLDDPYHCPHGRPTIVRMTHYELDKKFKRIV